jgi:hypothetical protein
VIGWYCQFFDHEHLYWCADGTRLKNGNHGGVMVRVSTTSPRAKPKALKVSVSVPNTVLWKHCTEVPDKVLAAYNEYIAR